MPHRQQKNDLALSSVDTGPARWLLIAVFVLLTALIVPARVGAMSVSLTHEELTHRSSLVAVADVIATQAQATSEGSIETRVVLAPVNTLKGVALGHITLTVPGGRLGSLSLVVSESPRFVAGERVIVFLDSEGHLSGGRDGVLRVDAGPVDGAYSSADAANEVEALATPTISSVSPAAAPAGIGETVRISGSGFGVWEAGSHVEFYYRGSTPIIASEEQIESWSDTQIDVEVPVGMVDGYPGSASSGPLYVVAADGSRSGPVDFTVTFSYGGARWSSLDQTFFVHENTGDYYGEGQLVRNAASAWCVPSAFSLTYGGSVASPQSGNSQNEVWWENDGDSGTLAVAHYWFWNDDMYEADVIFNDYYYWGTGSTSSNFDIQSVATHEFGHWLSLRDLYGQDDSDKIMYGTIGPGMQKRVLHTSEITGIRWIYDGWDVSPPSTTLSGVPDGWANAGLTVTLDATDNQGPITTYCRVGASSIQTYEGPFAVGAEGIYGIRYWSVDDAGNTETAKIATVHLDYSGPVTSIEGPAEDYARIALSLSATDALSGVASTYYRVDGGSPVLGSSVAIGETGTHTVEAWSVDVAGNVEDPPVTRTVVVKAPPHIELGRISGSNRYTTAIEISRATFADDGADTVVLATGQDFADALSASGLAGAYDGPLLLAKRDMLSGALLDELARLGTDDVVIVGGTAAIGESVSDALEDEGYAVDRIEGRTRYHTAAAVAERIESVAGVPDEVFVARGDSFADALAAAPYAYARTAPILLTRPTSLPGATADALDLLHAGGTRSALIAGGTSAVDPVVAGQIVSMGYSVTRAEGSNRYATAAALVEHAISAGWTTPSLIGVTTGEDFPDALGGGVAIGANGGAMVLTKSGYLHSEAEQVLCDCTDEVGQIEVFGGETAVSSTVWNEIRDIWNLP